MTEAEQVEVRSLGAPPPMPPEIAKAIVAVMKKVRAIRKDADNKQGGYKYVSVDQFYEEVREAMAEAGIFTLTHEDSIVVEAKKSVDSYGKERVSNWMTGIYHIWIYHESGAAYGPVKREMKVVASGPQAYGSAPSFVEKYFLRALLKIATGDVDADSHPQDGLPQTGKGGRQDDDGFSSAVDTYVKNGKKRIIEFTNVADLKNWWVGEEKMMQGLFENENDPKFLDLRAVYMKHGASLKNREAAPVTNGATPPKTNGQHMTNDAIPY